MAHKLWATRGMTLAEKLDFYSIPEPMSGCKLWTGHANDQGYGCLRHEGKMRKAHVLAFINATGIVPARGQVVRHRCDNPSCIEETHLLLGTQKDNVADCRQRGRMWMPRGEANSTSKLTDEKVLEILLATGTQTEIAERFGVSQQLISRVRLRQGWGHVAVPTALQGDAR